MGKRRKIDKESLLKKMEYDFSRDAEWFKRTNRKVEEVKEELEKKFYSEEKRKQKVEFMMKLKAKLKDYEDALKFEERYKKVRFVERRKVERKMKSVKRRLQECNDDEERKQLLKEQEEIEKDLNYVKYYPKTYKYYSLFPNKDKDKKEMVEKREMMRKKIEFYVNKKMKKKGGNDNGDNAIEDLNSDVDVEGDDNDNSNDIEKKSSDNDNNNTAESNVDGNNKQQKKNKQIKKDKNIKNNTNNKTNNNTNNNQNYESQSKHIKKQPFKDPFFELDE